MAGLTGKRLGRYQVMEQIGRGGMAAVYRGRDPSEGRIVALKVVAPHLSDDPNFEARFQREAEFLKRLKHPHIIPVEDFGESDGYAYLVLPFLEVGTLTDWLREGPVSLRHGSRLMNQISGALQHAHDHGIVHRDVKPSNILLDDGGNAMLSDFGLARPQQEDVSLTGSMFVGTPAFMSPEQVQGQKADALSDQYSLAVILYLLTTGRLPFQGETPMATALKHLNDPVPGVRTDRPNVPEAVEHVILKATAKDPHDRFSSVAELNQVFQEAVSHAIDPTATPAPAIQLPGSVQPTMALKEPGTDWRMTSLKMAGIPALVLLLVLAYPVLASGKVSVLELFSPASDGTPAIAAGLDLNDDRYGALSGTIEAMSTELAGSRAELMQAEQVQTAVIQTLEAAGSIGVSSTPTGGVKPTDAFALFLTPVSLQTPVPTRTPTTIGPPPTTTWTATTGPSPTWSPTVEASSTTAPSVTPALSATPGPSATPPASATPTPTSTWSSTPTLPPTATPTVDVCSLLGSSSLGVSGKVVSLDITNDGAASVTISHAFLDWPVANGSLRKVRLGGSLLWNAVDSSPPSDVVPYKGNPTISGGGTTKKLSFEFEVTAAGTGYDLQVELVGIGCQINAGK
jgi:serine/threonine-protein kinase